jgi:hypothetical protein
MADAWDRLVESCVSLAWSLWGELGASTWERRHQGWAIELEPLIAFTASLVEHDRRLLREAVDWCATNAAFVSLSQYRHVIAAPLWEDDRSFARLSATMTSLTGRSWPGSEVAPPYEVALSGKSRLRELSVPSLLQLRLRAMFGVGTRAELVRLMLLNPFQEWSVAQLGERVAYTQRQAATDLDMLVKAGLVERSGGGPSRHVLRDVGALRAVVGRVPDFAPRWLPTFQVLSSMAGALDAVAAGHLRQPDVEMARRLRLVEPAIVASGLPRPPSAEGGDSAGRAIEWALDVADALASADPSVLADRAKVPAGAEATSAVP